MFNRRTIQVLKRSCRASGLGLHGVVWNAVQRAVFQLGAVQSTEVHYALPTVDIVCSFPTSGIGFIVFSIDVFTAGISRDLAAYTRFHLSSTDNVGVRVDD